MSVGQNRNRGDVKFDKAFDLFAQDTQDVILDACERLPAWPCTEKGCEFDLLVRPNTTICFLQDFNSWGVRSPRLRLEASQPLAA